MSTGDQKKTKDVQNKPRLWSEQDLETDEVIRGLDRLHALRIQAFRDSEKLADGDLKKIVNVRSELGLERKP